MCLGTRALQVSGHKRQRRFRKNRKHSPKTRIVKSPLPPGGQLPNAFLSGSAEHAVQGSGMEVRFSRASCLKHQEERGEVATTTGASAKQKSRVIEGWRHAFRPASMLVHDSCKTYAETWGMNDPRLLCSGYTVTLQQQKPMTCTAPRPIPNDE